MKKRLLLVLMTLLTTSAMWADVYQDPVSNVKYGYGGNYGDEATVIDGSEASGDIVILDKISVGGVEYPVTSIGINAFDGCADLTSVTANSVITIAGWAFSGCSSLKSIEMDNLEDHGGESFLGTPWWKNQPDGLVCLGKMALGYKGTATGDFTLDIPENISFMNDFRFDSKRNLTSLTINIAGSLAAKYSFSSLGWNLKTVTVNGNFVAAEGCFNDCYFENLNINSPIVPQEIMCINQNLKEVHFGENVMEISMGAFEDCTGLTEIVIPTNVKTIKEAAFYGCSNLKTLTIGGETEVSHSFQECPVETLIVNGQTIRSRFGFVSSLGLSSPIELIIGKDVMEIDGNVFSWDNNIESVTILSDNLKIGGNAFNECKKLTSISFEGSSVEFEGSIGTLSALTDIHFSDNVTTIKVNDYYCAFKGCNALTNVTGGDNVTYIGGCYSGVFPKTSVWFTSQPDGMIYIGKVAYCYKGDMPEGTHYVIEDGTTAICGYAFYGCTGLTSVLIPATITSIGSYSFDGCSGVDNVYCYADPEELTWDGDGFKSGKATFFHITDKSEWEAKFPNSNVTFVGDIRPETVITNTIVRNDEQEYWTSFYDSTENYIAADGVKVYMVNVTNNQLSLIEVTDRVINKGQGVVLKSTTGNVALTYSETESSTDYSQNSLTGTDVDITNPGNAYVLNSKTSGLGFYKLSVTGKIGANKGYLVNSSTDARNFMAFDGEDATGINVSLRNSERVKSEVYNLSGRRVSRSTKGSIYVIGGKKMMMK